MSPEVLSLLDAFPDLICMVEANGAIVVVNQAFARALGQAAEQLAGHSIFDILETPAGRAAEYLRRCGGMRQPLPGTLRFRSAGGDVLACRCEGAVLRPGGGIAPGILLLRCRPKPQAVSRFTLLNQKIIELTREILRRRQAEDELRRANALLGQHADERAQQLATASAQLDESERRFHLMVRNVRDYAIFTLDPTGRVTQWNTGAQRIKGYSATEIVGQHFSRFYTEEDRQAGVPDRALATATRTGKYEIEGWRVRKDGSLFWASVVIDAIWNDDGRLIGFAKITRDLTERRAAEEQLRQSQKMEAIGQLTGGIAHDFNNLLTVIGGNIETMQRRLASEDRRIVRMFDAATRAVDRATVLTHRLLAFSRRQPLDPKPTDVNRLIIGMSDLLSRSLGEQIKIETVLSGGLWNVFVDPNQLENAILNLAVNARDAMPNGGRLTIESANTYLDDAYAARHDEVDPGQYVMLAVSDTGLGMSEEIVSKAFEPFFTTKGIGEGTGLGLSQVYGFVKQSRGHVKIYSEPGEGTTLRLYLPRAMTPDVVAETAQKPGQVSSAGESETILVVEDDEDVRAHTTELLRELGYKVLEAAEGDTALGLLASKPDIQLLFTDVGLPGAFNGRQLADEARKRRPELKVLFATGYARNAVVHHGRLDPGVDLLVKPFTYEALAAKIRLVLDKKPERPADEGSSPL